MRLLQFWITHLLHPSRAKKHYFAIRGISLPPLAHCPRRHGSVWAVGVVRDEIDILPFTLAHFLQQGVAHILVADNGSQDGTREYLRHLSQLDPRIHVALDDEPAHIQSEKMTWLAHQAWRAGAEWVIPFDADELWFAPRGARLASWLDEQSSSIVFAEFHHMVSMRERDAVDCDTPFMMDLTPSFPGKVAFRAHPFAWVGPGNHLVRRTGISGVGLRIAHAQYRSPEQLMRKARQGITASRLTGEDMSWFAPHWQAAAALDENAIEDVYSRIKEGFPAPEIKFSAVGPMVRVHPLRWRTWDQTGEIRSSHEHGREKP